MTDAKKRKIPASYQLLVFAIIFLTNPIVNIFDYFPDFIGYLIVARSLRYFSERAPYFEEARSAFSRLTIVSLAKIPSYFIMIYARGQNAMDNDIKSLFTFTFTVIELVFLVDGLKNLFSALTYLGQRGDALSLIHPFPLNKRGREMSTDALKVTTYVFVFLKAGLTAIPEMLLLTHGVDAGSYEKIFNLASLYPYSIILSFLTVFIYGIILTGYYKKFLRAIYEEGAMKDSADSLLDAARRESLDRTLMLKKMSGALSTFVVSAFLTVDIAFDNLLGINLLPRFIFGIVVIVALLRLSKFTGGSKRALPFAILYTLSAAIAYAMSVRFLTSHGYGALADSLSARADYIPVIATSVAEFILATLLIIFSSLEVSRFSRLHTGLLPTDERYSRSDVTYHRETSRLITVWGVVGVLVFLGKTLDTVQRYFSENKLTSTTNEVITTTYSALPWFGTVVLILSVVYIGISIHLFSRIKEDCEMKYS